MDAKRPVDNFDLSLNITELEPMTNCGFMSIDQTFHTPSFGDEEFEVPPLSLAGPGRCNGQEYFTNQIVSYHRAQALPLPQEQNSCHQLSNGTLFHVPSHHQQQHIMSNGHQQYHSNQMSPPPQQQSRGSSLSPPNHITQQQQQQQQNMYQNDMMHSMNMQLQQSFDVQTTFSNTPVHQRAMHPQMAQHLLQQQQQQQQANSVMGSPGAMGPPQQVFSTISQSQLTNQLGLQIGGVQHHHHNNQRPPSVGGSTPPISNHNSPGRETSEDSDDSTPLTQLNATRKRPSPEPVEIPPPKVTKKTKPQKKKKKRDPNEPQKPVSAYALFFRDTQAAIKGQNPNASFGEVSKIVASMWDGLETEAKNVYKKKTETAKKEYLKALAAYRATLVSKAAVDQSDSMYSSLPMGSSSPPVTNSPVTSPSGVMLSPMQKKSPPFPTLIDTMQPVTLSGHPQQLVTNQQVWHMSSQHMMNSNSPPQMMQGTTMVNMQQHQQPPTSQMAVMNHPQPQQMSSVPPQHCQSASNSPNYLQNMSPVSIGGVHPNMGNREMMMPVQICLRSGCSNPAVESEEWENDYCSSECVVSHCKDVFSAWVAQRQASAVK